MLSKWLNKDNALSSLDKDLAAAYVRLGARKEDAPVEPDLARTTLIDILTKHGDLVSQQGGDAQAGSLFALAIELADEDYIETLLSDTDEGAVADRARAMMRRGHFVIAMKLFEKALIAQPNSGKINKNLAAIYHRTDNASRARELLTGYYRENPLEVGNIKDSSADTILCMYGYDKSEVKLGFKEGIGFRRYRSGGHFMLKHLLNQASYNIQRYTIAADNINIGDALPECDIMINTVADADTEFASLKSLEAYLNDHDHIKVINHPSRVLETTRDNNFKRLNTLPGVRFPRTQRFNAKTTSSIKLAEKIINDGFKLPLIIRETGTHTAVSTALIDTQDALQTYLENVSGDTVYVIEFIENASAEGHYSKMRFFSIDGTLYPVVHHIDQVWNVHGDNRKEFMASHKWMIEREQKFLENPASIIGDAVYQRLQQLPKIIGLDFFGFDFTLLDNEDVLIFELNPAMRHSFKHGMNFPYMMPHLQAISDAFDKMIKERISRSKK